MTSFPATVTRHAVCRAQKALGVAGPFSQGVINTERQDRTYSQEPETGLRHDSNRG